MILDLKTDFVLLNLQLLRLSNRVRTATIRSWSCFVRSTPPSTQTQWSMKRKDIARLSNIVFFLYSVITISWNQWGVWRFLESRFWLVILCLYALDLPLSCVLCGEWVDRVVGLCEALHGHGPQAEQDDPAGAAQRGRTLSPSGGARWLRRVLDPARPLSQLARWGFTEIKSFIKPPSVEWSFIKGPVSIGRCVNIPLYFR